ncbi:MAG: nucleoside hydrolase [Schwartzia sp. (in: firmicutes)]
MSEMFDDGIAMLMLLQSPQIELMGITIVTGNTWTEAGTANAIRQLEGLERSDIPVIIDTPPARIKARFAKIRTRPRHDTPRI